MTHFLVSIQVADQLSGSDVNAPVNGAGFSSLRGSPSSFLPFPPDVPLIKRIVVQTVSDPLISSE